MPETGRRKHRRRRMEGYDPPQEFQLPGAFMIFIQVPVAKMASPLFLRAASNSSQLIS